MFKLILLISSLELVGKIDVFLFGKGEAKIVTLCSQRL